MFASRGADFLLKPMTPWVIEFLRTSKLATGEPRKILEVGSLDVNGSARQVYETPEVDYIGMDMVPGKGVDMILDAHDLELEDEFDVIICCETLEHDTEFWKTVKNMKRALKPGGWLVITTPGFHFPQHDYPRDYYRFMGQTYHDVFFKGMKNVHVEEFNNLGGVPGKPDWVGGWAQK